MESDICARCGQVIDDCEWWVEAADGRPVHEEWSRTTCDENQKARQQELAL